MKELCECHGHIFMDGEDYRLARARHEKAVDETALRRELQKLQEVGVVYFRSGGDALGVGLRAREIAGEYGITFRTPAFAIHRAGLYGGIVGRAYGSLGEYEQLLEQVRAQKGDFVKLMLSGILTFKAYGELSCPSVEEGELRTLIRLAHEAGFAVMVHADGEKTVEAAVEAGAESVEHGYFLSERCVDAMAERGTLWVPTLAAIAAFTRREGYDSRIPEETLRIQQQRVRRGLERGALIASGSDSGAWGVPHGSGILTELELLGDECRRGNEALRRIF